MNRIPDYSELRAAKPGYDTRYQIDTEHPLHNDPLVDVREAEFGFSDASSYYARPNKMTGESLPGVPDAPLVRLDIAKRLVRAEQYLRTDKEVRELLGAPARLKIDDALRPHQVQKYAFEVAWPKVIRETNPELSDEEVAQQVPNYCARPNENQTPTPHLTGGAVDVKLINLATDVAFDRGHKGGAIKGSAYPDFYEGDVTASDEIIMGRRILYYAMTSVAGLYVNPQEIWHYGKGDPLSEFVSGSHQPYYGVATLPDWYERKMGEL